MTAASPLTSEALEKLEAAQGKGLSQSAKDNPRRTIKLLQGKDDELKEGSRWYRAGARAGQYLLGDTLRDHFVWTPILYLNTFVEWKVRGEGYAGTHYALPPDAKWDAEARCYFCTNRNSVEEGAEIVGLVNGEVWWLAFRMGALAVARHLNGAANSLRLKTANELVRLPFFGANYRMASIEKQGSSGKTHWLPTFEFVARVGEEGGPTWDDFHRCYELCDALNPIPLVQPKNEWAGTSQSEEPPDSGAPPPTGDDSPRSLDDLEDEIRF
jgi:hypothetical protein